MKELKAIDLEHARGLLIQSCQQDIKDNNNIWSTFGFIGKSFVQEKKDLIKRLGGSSSVSELVCIVGESSSDTLKRLIVLKIYQTPEDEIDRRAEDVRQRALIAGAGRYGSPVPGRETVINDYFQYYLKNARSRNTAVELH